MKIFNLDSFYFIFYLHYIFTLNIVQTEDHTLHFIEDRIIDSVKISKLKHNVPAITDGQESDNTSISLSTRSIIDNIAVTEDGLINFDNLSFSIESLQSEPKIYKNVIFQTQKRCETISKHDTIIFLGYIDLKITDSKTLYTRTETFTYIYYPFSIGKEISVHNDSVTLSDKKYKFKENIVAIYDTIDYNGATYMNRIYTNTNIHVYTPKFEVKTGSLMKYWVLLLIPALFVYFIIPKNIKTENIDYETDDYIVYKGKYNNSPAVIKKYKKNRTNISKEVAALNKLDHPSIKKVLYSDERIFKPFIVFEDSNRVISMDKYDLLQFVQVILYLNENNLTYKNFNPLNIRRKNGRIILFNIHSNDNKTGWYTQCPDYDDFAQDLQSVGVILHYYLTGYHPYDLEENTKPSKFIFVKKKELKDDVILSNIDNINSNTVFPDNTVKLKQYSDRELEVIEDNMKNRRYLIRTKTSLEHDLIYHTIKNKTTMLKLSKHPFFWSPDKVFNFLASYSDVVEGSPSQARKLERNKCRIFETAWNNFLDDIVKDELEIFRYYNYNNAKDLIRVIRNKGRHYNQIPEVVKEVYKSFPGGFVDYWLGLFPKLLIVCYNCGETLKDNELLKEFY